MNQTQHPLAGLGTLKGLGGICANLALLSYLGMLRSIGVPATRLLDMLATGLVIGAGPGPMHSLIGILESGKKTLENIGQGFDPSGVPLFTPYATT